MRCPNCGTENEITSKRKFCVKCGTNLANPDEVNIEQVDFGGYHSEESDNFKISNGTFKINDKTPQTESMFVSSDELNESYDDFEDEPYIPSLDSERVKLPENTDNSQLNNNNNNINNGMPYPNTNINPNPNPNPAMYCQQGGVNPMMYQQNMYGYGQPVMQPQFMGYDANGMPVYAQIMMMPQFVGYDMNGMPIYMPVPVYPQNMQNMQNPQMFPNMQNPQMFPNMQNPQMFPNMQNPQNIPNMQNPQNIPNFMYGAAPAPQPQNPVVESPSPKPPEKTEKKESLWSDFLEDDIKKSESRKTEEKRGNPDDDFFSKTQRSKNMNDVSAEGLDLSRLERREHKKEKYMSAAPEADASQLAPNAAKTGGKYMKATGKVNADDLQQNSSAKSRVKMGKTAEANPDELEQYVRKAPEIKMGQTQKADASQLKAYEHEHVESIMAGADHAVEAMPKKKVYVDELDQIELPVYMKAKKSKPKSHTAEIPSLPDIKS